MPVTDCEDVRCTTMQHVAPVAVRFFETLNGAQMLYLNSMRIAPFPLLTEVPAEDEAMRVELRVDLRNWTAPQHTLAVHISPEFVKTFVFEPGTQAVGVPCSSRRQTSVEIKCFNDGEQVDARFARSFLLDLDLQKSTVVDGPVTLGSPADKYRFHTAVKQGTHSANFTFACYEYKADAKPATGSTFEYATPDAWKEFNQLLALPVITPSRSPSTISAQQAETELIKLETCVQELHHVFDSMFYQTARSELGATDDTVEHIACSVDWSKSFAVSDDHPVQDLIDSTKRLYTLISVLSNTAVDGTWMTDAAVNEMLKVREKLADSVRGRRTRLEQVSQVRTTFLCLDAIDSMLRRMCSNDSPLDRKDSVNEILQMPCHRYWLEQMKANTHNAVTLEPGTVSEAVLVLDACSALRKHTPLLPESSALRSALGFKMWQSMHLQGLSATHALPVAPCAHFLYKKRARVDYTVHPVVAQASPLCTREPLALLTMLVSTDVEHRIIPQKLGAHILNLLGRATVADAEESSVLEATGFLARVLDPQLHSLATSALGRAPAAEDTDLCFITDAGSKPGTTGYNMQEVTSFMLRAAGV